MKGLASGVLGAVVAGSTAGRLALAADAPAPAAAPPAPPTGPFKLPPLTYDYAALEPSIDALTMKIHHDKHHQAYINNLNIAVKGHPDLAAMSVEELLKSLDKVPEPIRMAVRNNAGGHANHTLFWTVMGPGKGGAPTGK
ncbi:MAG: superoxide dismutase, partial [Planctomycetia bacterium]|nr:superoxide dismutase [Planctomycetia bacterium]